MKLSLIHGVVEFEMAPTTVPRAVGSTPGKLHRPAHCHELYAKGTTPHETNGLQVVFPAPRFH